MREKNKAAEAEEEKAKQAALSEARRQAGIKGGNATLALHTPEEWSERSRRGGYAAAELLTAEERSERARQLSALGASAGGKASARRLTPEERSERARKAGQAGGKARARALSPAERKAIGKLGGTQKAINEDYADGDLT